MMNPFLLMTSTIGLVLSRLGNHSRFHFRLLSVLFRLYVMDDLLYIPETSSSTLVSVNFGFLSNPEDIDLDNRDAWED